MISLTIEEIVKVEKVFSQNRYDGDLTDDNYFKYIKGNIPVLVSAPHATNHITANGDFKMSDAFTGTLAIILGNLTGAHVIHLTKQAGKNPNSDDITHCSYKQKMIEIINKNQINFVLDLHAASIKRDFDIDLGTNYGKSMNSHNVELIKNLASKFDILDIRENDTFKADGPNNITRYCSATLGVEAIQFEINKRLRNPGNDFNSFLKLIQYLQSIIQALHN